MADVEELLPQPARAIGAALDIVRLGVHHRSAIALEVLARDDRPAENIARRPDLPSRHDDLLVALVEVVAHDDTIAQAVAHEPVELLTRESVVQQIEADVAARP